MRVLLTVGEKKYWSWVDFDGEISGSYINVFAIQDLEIEFKPNHWTNCYERIEEFEDQICDNINNPQLRTA